MHCPHMVTVARVLSVQSCLTFITYCPKGFVMFKLEDSYHSMVRCIQAMWHCMFPLCDELCMGFAESARFVAQKG